MSKRRNEPTMGGTNEVKSGEMWLERGADAAAAAEGKAGMSEEMRDLTNEIMADLLDRQGILDGVDDAALSDISGVILGVMHRARASGASAERAQWVAVAKEMIDSANSEWHFDDNLRGRIDGLKSLLARMLP